MPESIGLPVERKSLAGVEMEKAGGGGMLMPKSLGEVVSFAEMMSRADIALPKHLRNNPGACMAVAMQAMRWEMDPFSVANKSYAVNDRLAYEAQLIAAVIHTRAPIRGRPEYVYTGEGATRRCQVVCVMADGQTREYTSPEFGQITTKNSPLWKSDPDQQLGYFSIRGWGRRHTPEVVLGVYTPEEVETLRDVTPRTSGLAARLTGGTTEGFSATGLDDAIDGVADDISQLRVTAVLDDILEGDAIPDSPTPEPEPSDPMSIDIRGATSSQRSAWVEGLRALIMQQKTADGAIAIWKTHFTDRIRPLHELEPEVYTTLDRWMDARVRRLRSTKESG